MNKPPGFPPAATPIKADETIALCVIVAASLVSVFLAGGVLQGALGVFLLPAGLVLVFSRPGCVVPWRFWVGGALVAIAGATALLPERVFSIPSWRVELERLPALRLPESVSLDPFSTLFWLALLGLSLLVALRVLSCRLDQRGMERVALLMVLGCSAYAVTAWFAWQTGWRYPFFEKPSWAEPAFGFFPNRNHTAGFLLTGAVLSLGLVHRGMNGGGFLTGIVGGGGLALLSSMLLVFSKSRGGLVFLMLGVLIWIAGLGKYRSRALMAGSVALVLFMGVLFAGSRSELLERIKPSPHTDEPADGLLLPAITEAKPRPAGNHEYDSRIPIWQDSLRMIRDYPLSGSGLGTYAIDYPFYADKSLADDKTALHAESDWITLCAEGGIPALLSALACVAALSFRIPRLSLLSGREWPLRWAFLAAFFAELLHGFVDVPLHKPSLAWWIMLLGGVGFGGCFGEVSAESVHAVARRLQRLLFILGGAGCITAGVLLIHAQWGGGAALPPFAADAALKRIASLHRGGDPSSVDQSLRECLRELSRHPAYYRLHNQLAILRISKDGHVGNAMEILEASQHLWPHDPWLVFEQGKLIAAGDPLKGAEFWNESLRRQLAMDASPGSPIRRSPGLFGSMLEAAKSNPVLLARMPALASYDRDLRLQLYNHPTCDPSLIAQAAQDQAFMESLSPIQQGRLIDLWWRRGDWPTVTAYVDANPRYQRAAVLTRSRILASVGSYEQACRLLIDTFSIPMPEPKKNGGIIIAAGSDVPSDPLEAARYYMERGNDLSARRLLGEALRSGGGGVGGRDALLLRAQLEVRSGNWKSALDTLISYLRATKQL